MTHFVDMKKSLTWYQRIERKDIQILFAFGEVTHFKGLNFSIVFCFDCSNINFCSAV